MRYQDLIETIDAETHAAFKHGCYKRIRENSNVLASYTDQDGYTSSIVSTDDPTGQGRCGIEYISDGKTTVKAGYWMNYPEKEWNISDEQWQRMSLADRAALEVKQQATAYAPLKDQFAYWITRQNKPEDKRPLIAHKWSTGKRLTPSEAAILKTMTRSEIHHEIDQRTKQVREGVMVDEIHNIKPHDVFVNGICNKCIRMKPRELFGTYGNIKVFCKRDNKHFYFIIKDEDGRVVGGAYLVEWKDGSWFVNEIGVLYRYEGYGYNFYKLLLSKGMRLISGDSQTPDGKKVWKKLMNDPAVSVRAFRMVSGADPQGAEDTLEPTESDDPWSDDDVYLIATSKLNESVMVDEITLFGSKNRSAYEKRNWDKKVIAKAAKTNGKAKKLGVIDDINVVLYADTEDDYQMAILSTKQPKENIGYLTLEFRHWGDEIEGWFCEVGLRSDYVGRGIGFKLYQLMISKGFDLVSGYDQTAGSKSIWTKLMNTPGVKVQAIVGDGGDEELVDLKGIDPWKDRTVLLRATRKSVRESVMIDEINTNDWWNMSDADMDTRLNVVDIDSLDYFDDIDSEYSVYTKHDKFYIYDKKTKRLIGYANISILRDVQDRRNVIIDEIALRPSYRGKNIAYGFYLMLLSLGYIIVSDSIQTAGGASIWKKLLGNPEIKITTYDPTKEEVDPADAWKHPHTRLQAEMINESVEPMTETNIRNGIRYVVGVPLKVFGKIDDIIVSMGQKDDECMFLFSVGGDKREAIGYASATMKKIHIDKKTFTVLNITDLGLYRRYRRKGIGFAFYNMLLEDGYVLISDETQTGEGEGLWRKLMKQPGIGVTTVKATKSEDKFEHIDLVADDPWAMKNVRIILQAGNQEITEGTPRVAAIQPQPKGLERCTTVATNALLSHFKKPLIDNAATVPRTAKGCFDLLQRRGLKVQPDITAPQKKVTVKVFANTHQNGAWFIGTPHHALAIIDGELFDTENKGLDGRLVRVVARIVP